MFRSRSIISIRLATTSRYSCGHSLGISVTGVESVPREPLRLGLSARHLPREHNLKSPKAKIDIRSGPMLRDKASGFIVGEQAVPVVHIPIQLLLERDHLAADPGVVGAGGV